MQHDVPRSSAPARGRPGALAALVTAVLAAALIASPARGQAGGAVLYENGSPDMGSAYAGATARAQDAATAFQNPAGMTRLDQNHLLLGTFGVFISNEFDIDRARSVANPPGFYNDGGSLDQFAPGLGSFTVMSVSEKLKIGISINALAAAGVEYESQWIGRTFITENKLLIANMQPSVAYKVNDWLSLGAGVNVVYGSLDQDLRASSAFDAPTIKIDDADDWGLGGTFGVLVELREGTRFGLSYRTQIDLDLSGDLQSPLPITVNVDTSFDLPQGFNVGVYHELNEKLALLADAGWTNWSEFDRQGIAVGPAGVSIPRDWDDTWRAAIGAQYRLADDWMLRAGCSYDSSPVDDDKRLPDVPVGEQYRFSVGVQHDFGEGKVFGLSYTFMYAPMDVDQVALPGGVVLDGEYNDSYINFVSFNLSLAF